MPDEGKVKCKICGNKYHKPLLAKHLYLEHGIK